jgi:glycosyltransferase involved in cell wall biosynthesis
MRGLVIGIDGRYLQDKFDGVGRYTFGLVDALRRTDAGQSIVLFWDPSLPNSRFALEGLSDPPRLRIETIRLPLYSVREQLWLRTMTRRLGIDVFHSPYFWSPVLLQCPLVTTVHDMIFDRHPEYIPGSRYRFPYWLSSRVMTRRARALIAVSGATAEDVIRYAGRRFASRLAVIPNGVDTRFRPRHDPDVRRRYGLPERFVLAVGARRPHKNIPRLVAAFERAAPWVPHHLVLAGAVDNRFRSQESPAASRLKAQGRLLEIGRVKEEDLPALYSAADLFVQPSIIEGFGLPLLEAMACGAATACSNASSLVEVAGDASELFDPRSEGSIASALERVLTSPALRAQLASRGLRRAQRYRWEAIAAATLDVYRWAADPARDPLPRRVVVE